MRIDKCLCGLFFSMLFSACAEEGLKDFAIQPEFGLSPVENPVKSAQAQDGTEWIDGTITGRTIGFVFRSLSGDGLKSVPVRFSVEEGASMTDPSGSSAVLDLSGECAVTVSDGYNPIKYVVKASEYPLLKSITVKIGSETNTGSPDGQGNIVLSFVSPDVANATVSLELNDDVVPVSPTVAESTQDLSAPLPVKVKDNKTGRVKEYLLTINQNWVDVTAELNTDGVSLPDFVTVFRNTNLHGRIGNKGYVVKIPAGNIDMKVSYKVKANSTWFDDDQRLSDVVAANSDYCLFATGIGVIYYKPIVRGLAINNGVVSGDGTGGKAVPWFHWNIKYYTCPPTLGIKDGKAAISYADVLGDEKLYKFGIPQHGTDKSAFVGGVLWDVDAAVSGYSMPLRNGEIQVRDESAADYKTLADLERNHSFNNVKEGMQISNYSIWYQGADVKSLSAHLADGERMGRNMVGVTPNGDLLIFVSERYSGTNNALKSESDPSDGSTLQEAATVLKEFGCSDAMALHQIQFSVVSLQDGAIGKDLTRTELRTGKSAGSDVLASTIIMFKGNMAPVPDGYGNPNTAGSTIHETDPYAFD